METPVAPAPTKIVQEYQATDREGNPIGKPTRLVADTPEEMYEKMRTAHVLAMQALDRQNKAYQDLKRAKLQPKVEPVVKPLTHEEEQKAFIDAQNPVTAKDAIRKLSGTNELEERLKKAEDEAARARGKEQALIFMRNHLHDFYACQANSKALGDFLTREGLEFTADNLEIAFAAIGDDLAQDPNKQPSNNEPTIAVEPVVQTAPPSEQKPGRPNFGIQPGSGAGARPVTKTGMTKKDVIELMRNNKTEFRRRMSDPKLKAEMDAALARG